jgi:phage shock protein A
MTWLKRQLRDAQDTIVQLCETQRKLEERNVKQFREGEAIEEKACAALASAQKKHD